MGVSFVTVGPMIAIAAQTPGAEGARLLFGSIIGAGVIGLFIAPMISRFVRYFPPVVTGTIILVVGITLMRVGINWIFGAPVGPTAPPGPVGPTAPSAPAGPVSPEQAVRTIARAAAKSPTFP